MLFRGLSARSKQLARALERWEEDGGPAAADYPVARDNGSGAATGVLVIGEQEARAWLRADALVSGNTRIALALDEIRRMHCSPRSTSRSGARLQRGVAQPRPADPGYSLSRSRSRLH
jgi:hypothetical protein